jgi:superfamily I DNA and/or RNA helicase
MHPDVAHFASTEFYDGQLLPVPIAHQKATSLDYDARAEDSLDELLKEHRVLFLPVTPVATVPDVSPSDLATIPDASPSGLNSNEAEARLVADLLRRIHRFYGDRFDADKTVGVIVPYRNQIAAIRAAIEKTGIKELRDVSVDTVERYQGSQRDVIIYSFTVTRRYQLDFLTASTYEDNGRSVDRKLNVALTRARKQMIMVGNPEVLRHNPLFRQLIDTYSNKESNGI